MKKVITAIVLATAIGTASAQGMWQPPSMWTPPGTMGGSSSSPSLFDDLDRQRQEADRQQEQRQQQYRMQELERQNRNLQQDIDLYNSMRMAPRRPY